jgi:ATP/maltotriose-dependent transcriptional regulator MalT/DNA-binding SARP family transcriptional activator
VIGRGQYPRVDTTSFRPDLGNLDLLSFGQPFVAMRSGLEEFRVPVEGEPVIRPAVGLDQFAFPLQPGKVQRPLLPESTVRRDRLLDWLAGQSGRRLVYVTAEAGFGKTTLVADYTRRARVRTFWYRLDDGDTDGLVFLRYLIAACRAADDTLLLRAAALVSEASIEPLRHETVLEAVLDEIRQLGEIPSVLVLDDFHTVEEKASLRAVVERIIARAPDHLGIIVMARRTPALSVAALRARGEIVELGRDALRFEESETVRLFEDSYRHRLDRSVIHELQTRTDGWPASIGLVRTAVESRSPSQARAFVESLSGAEGSLYDYVAEEVVGDLSEELRRFLLRVVLLEEIDIENAALAAGISEPDARRLIADAQRLSLLARGDALVGAWRAHPLVRDFMASHLEAEVGPAGVAAIHRHLAGLLERTSWRLAARHWAAAGEAEQVRRVICAAVPAIIGTGDLTAAADLIAHFPDQAPNPWYDIIRSRQSAAEGRYEEALRWARHAEETGPSLPGADPLFATSSALNLLFLGIRARNESVRAEAFAKLDPCDDPELTAIVDSSRLLAASDEGGGLDALSDQLRTTIRLNRDRRHGRYEGISLLNLAVCELARGNPKGAADAALHALSLLEVSGEVGDVAAAHSSAAHALVQCGRPTEAAEHARSALGTPDTEAEPYAILEIAELEAMYGDPVVGMGILRELEVADPSLSSDPRYRLIEARLRMLTRDDLDQSLQIGNARPHGPVPGFRAAVMSLRVQALAMAGAPGPTLTSSISLALEHTGSQQAWFWWRSVNLTRVLTSERETLNEYVAAQSKEDAAHLSMQAELVLSRLDDLDERSLAAVRRETELRPGRWRGPIRRVLADPKQGIVQTRRCAAFLEVIGESADVRILRSLARTKTLRLPDAGRALCRRLAPHVHVEDLGRVSVRVGGRLVTGTEIRRKVLALLTFLISRPQFTASREQVIEALWPEMAPEQGANSLNQTAYFLRRVLEPEADDETSAGYLNSKGDLIWLDADLVSTQSGLCLDLIARARRSPTPEVISLLVEAYPARFAVDFTYEDWAATFRDTLHASYLDRIEKALDLDLRIGALDRATSVAENALRADPEADHIELRLVHLYRANGAHAAAAGLYAHYSAFMREQLGVEPPPLESI